MALGGGQFTTQTAILPGTYMNFVSAPKTESSLGERGIVAMPIALKWGEQGKLVTLTAKEFKDNSLNILGYKENADELMPFREVFKNASKVLVYNLTSGGTAASCTYATAKYTGALGNLLQVIIQKNVDNDTLYDVTLVRTDMGNHEVDKQIVASAADLKDNDFVTWATDATLTVTAGTPLTGGEDGTVSTGAYQTALNKLEPYTFNTIPGVMPDNTDATTLNALYAEYTKRRRATTNNKMQCVLSSDAATPDHEGCVQLPAKQANALYWAAGALAAAAGNTSCTNKTYDGELVIDVDYTQVELEQFIKKGIFVFHAVEDEVRVLTDINTFVSYTNEKGEDFSKNQAIRGMDMLAIGINRKHNNDFIGKVQHDASGRVSLWDAVADLIKEQVENGTVEAFDANALEVTAGKQPQSNVIKTRLKYVCAMEKLYMSVEVG